MRDIPHEQIHFLIKRGLQELSRSTLADLTGSDERRTRGLEEATTKIAERFKRLTVTGPDAVAAPGDRVPGER